MILNLLLIALLIARPTPQMLAWVAALSIIRYWPWTATALARKFDLESYCGLTAWLARYVLPGWTPDEELMSREAERAQEIAQRPVSIPVSSMAYQPPPHGADIADMDAETDALRRLARDITDEQLLILICELRTPDGKFRHSANEVYRRVGGDRNAVLAQIKAIRENTPPPQFRQPDATTAPATHPVTGGGS